MNVRIKRRYYGIRKHRLWKRNDQEQIRRLLCLVLLGMLAGSMLFLFEENLPHDLHRVKGKFAVEEGLEIHKEVSGAYKIDALLPQVVSNLRDATDLGAEIATDFYYLYDLNKENVAEAFSGWKEPNIQVSYQVTKKRQIYDIAITTKASSIYVYKPITIVKHYCYDVGKQKVVYTEKSFNRK